MGVSHSTTELVGKLHQAEKAIGDSGTRKSLLPVADRVKAVMVRSAVTAGVRPGSKIAHRPWRGVYVRNQGAKDLVVGYARPAHLVNYSTRSHVIGARSLGTRKFITRRVTAASVVSLLGARASARLPGTAGRKGAKALHFGGRFSAYATHPGTRGKRFFERALPQAQKDGADEMGHTVNRALARVFQ